MNKNTKRLPLTNHLTSKTRPINLALLMSACWAAPALSETLDVQLEVKANYRDSEQTQFPVGFPFGPTQLPVGAESAFIETVDEGGHAEISLVSAAGKWQLADALQLQFKVDAIDLYDRNPTSGDHKICLLYTSPSPRD